MTWERPVRQMIDTLDILQPLLERGAAHHDGHFWSFEGEPARFAGDPPSVMIAALGEQMLRLAGARTDGTILWSIEQVRDPSRVYEIHLMKELDGFRNLLWNTGFTNYRFAVPHFAGYRGRAIYNDVDQIYLADPAELFDAELGDHGYLAVSETDTSVMLIDCDKMGRFWTLDGARKRRKYGLIEAARAVPGTPKNSMTGMAQ